MLRQVYIIFFIIFFHMYNHAFSTESILEDQGNWEQLGEGVFTYENDVLVVEGGFGYIWYKKQMYQDFVMTVDWMTSRITDNSGIFLHFSRPIDIWTPTKTGVEIQIDDNGYPDHDTLHLTGSIYDLSRVLAFASNLPGTWNQFKIIFRNKKYQVYLNSKLVNEYNVNEPRVGYIGIQSHHKGSLVKFRNLTIEEL